MILVLVLSLWTRCFDWGTPEILRSWPLSIAFFSGRHRKIDFFEWFLLRWFGGRDSIKSSIANETTVKGFDGQPMLRLFVFSAAFRNQKNDWTRGFMNSLSMISVTVHVHSFAVLLQCTRHHLLHLLGRCPNFDQIETKRNWKVCAKFEAPLPTTSRS